MKLVRSVVLVWAAAALPLIPVAAHAKSYTHADAVGDMLAFTGEADAGTPAPEQANADVVSSSVQHKARTVVMRMTYRNLVANQDDVVGHFFSVKTGELRREIMIFTGSVFGTGGKAMLTKPDGTPVHCKVTRQIDYTTRTVVVKVPRTCLGNPRWVKVSMASVTGNTADTGTGNHVSYVDDALTNGTFTENGPTYSPKVRR